MKVAVQVVVASDDGAAAGGAGGGSIGAERPTAGELGLTRAEAKALLKNVQRARIEQQVAEHADRHRCYPDCGELRACKDHTVAYRHAPPALVRLPLPAAREAQPQPARSRR